MSSRRALAVVAMAAALVIWSVGPAAGGLLTASGAAGGTVGAAAPADAPLVQGSRSVPDELDIGTVEVGESTSRSFSFTNPEDSGITVEISSVSVSGPDADSFTIVRAPSSVSPGEEAEVEIRFSAQRVGDHDATVTVESNVGTESVALDGEGVEPAEPDVDLSPGEAGFGNVRVGSAANTSFVLRNTGDAPLAVNGVSLDGSDAFSLGSEAPATLGPGEQVAIEVGFAPSETGSAQGTLSVSTNDTDEGTVTASLSGSGVQSDVSVSPGSLEFGQTSLGETKELSLTVENGGSASVELAELAITGERAGAFEIVEGGSGGTLGPGESRTVTVAFTPTASGGGGQAGTGGYAATLAVETGSNGDGSLSVSLSGVGTAPRIAVAPQSINFGKVQIDSQATRELRVSNRGSDPLEVSGTSIVGASPDAFTILSGGGSFTLGPGETRTLSVAFSPTSENAQAAQLRITSNDPRSSQTDVWLSNTRTVVNIDRQEQNNTTSSNISANDVPAGEEVSVDVSQSVEREDEEDAPDEDEPDEEVPEDGETLEEISLETAERPAEAYCSGACPAGMPAQAGGGSYDFSLTVTTSSRSTVIGEDFVLASRNGTAPVAYKNITHSIPDENIEQVTFTKRVSKTTLEELNATIEDYAAYRYHDGEWVELEIEVIEETDEFYRLRVISPGLSDFTSGVKQPKFELINAQVTVTKITIGDNVGVRVTIRNVGGAEGTFSAQLLLDGEPVAQRDVTITAENDREITFEREIDEPGTYTVQVNNRTAGEVEVAPEEVDETPTASGDDGSSDSDGGGGGDDGDGGDDSGTSTSTPGFGAAGALAALAAAILFARRD